jgi:hypothetical protein
MIFAIDFDGTIVEQNNAYDDLQTPLEFVPGALEALRALKRAGHVIIVTSARANLALRIDYNLNPLWANRLVPFDANQWRQSRSLNASRYLQMLVFVSQHLDGVVDAVDNGHQGKVVADHFIDDRGVDFAQGWEQIARLYGEPSSVETHKEI